MKQIIVKEKGIFTNVISPTTKAKLRLLFEVAPLGLLIENAGGHSSDGKQSVLDKVVTNTDDRTQVAYGSKNEIIRFEETLYGTSRLAAELASASAWVPPKTYNLPSLDFSLVWYKFSPSSPFCQKLFHDLLSFPRNSKGFSCEHN